MSLQDVRERFFSRFPAARWVDRALRGATNPTPMFFLAPVRDDPDLREAGLALARLGSDLERRFSINGEVAWYFTPWVDFQRRSFNAITLRTHDLLKSLQVENGGLERFTASRRVVMLVSPDPDIRRKLDEWQRDSRRELIVVPIDAAGSDEARIKAAIVRELRDRLGARDLYRTQNPVEGDDFFGRSSLLRSMTAALEGDQNIAVLGLRRSGKTSVLRELRRQVISRRIVMTISDFQMLDASSIGELPASIASALNEDLKRARELGLDVWSGTESQRETRGMTLTGLSDRIKQVAARNPNLRFVIAVDEVESAAAIAKHNPQAVRSLLGALRSAAQSRDNVSLMFSGVANRMFRRSSLDAENMVDNPMFGQVSSVHLTSFDEGETAMLIRDLGTIMLLQWERAAIEEVHRLTGGYPYFVRDFAANIASHARARLPIGHDADSDTVPVSIADVEAVWDEWSKSASETWRGISSALRGHYPEAADLLDQGLSESEVNEWVAGDSEAGQAADDLAALGLFERSGNQIFHSSTLIALNSLGVANHRDDRLVSNDVSATEEITALLTAGESHTVEFKETSRIDVKSGAKEKYIEDAIVKTIAGFMNSDGGDLLIGVADSGATPGLQRDLALFEGSVDRYERWLTSDLLGKRIDAQLVADLVRVAFAQFRGKVLVRVTVGSSRSAAWVDNVKLYRRMGNQTVAVEGGREIAAFISQRV
ncbi:hypothetical protein CW368_07655 [Actinomycetales bacterium SN12]|nr:hypothetical protein CW368_07655 [Actinomycetales bacterium SN12]